MLQMSEGCDCALHKREKLYRHKSTPTTTTTMMPLARMRTTMMMYDEMRLIHLRLGMMEKQPKGDDMPSRSSVALHSAKVK